MMGIEARTGAWFDQIAVVCGQLRGDGSLARTKTLDRRGGGGGVPNAGVCSDNEAVSQLRAWRTDGFQIRSVELICQNIFTGATRVLSVRGTATSPDAHSPPHACKLPERATGLVIRYGAHVNGLALVCDGRRAPAAPTQTILPGSQTQKVRFEGTELELFTYRPNNSSCPRPNLLISLHGMSRTADNYRRYAIPIADKDCFIVVAPLFDKARFPGDDYGRDNMEKGGKILPPQQWTGRYIPLIVNWVRSVDNWPITFSVIGHSAGGQFASRLAAFHPTAARRIVVANPSSHVFPDVDVKAPYGFGGVYPRNEWDEQLRRYLAAPVTILLGQNDTGSTDLDVSAEGKAQGANRLDRGRNVFAKGQALAQKKGWTFNWRRVEVPGVGHSGKSECSGRRRQSTSYAE